MIPLDILEERRIIFSFGIKTIGKQKYTHLDK